MNQIVGIGNQDFEVIRKENYFYIDKTWFIKEWWEGGDSVTLITRPRRFGKTLTMSMVEKFFSVNYADRSDLFEGLRIWDSEKFRKLQGTYPVIGLSFANVKETDFESARERICGLIEELYIEFYYLLDSDKLVEPEKEAIRRGANHIEYKEAVSALNRMSKYLFKHYGKKVIILLDEYDTPMQEAYINGYWEELAAFTRNLFNSTFKTNPYLERAIMTGITRVSKESIFSDLNNLEVVTTTSKEYADCFGFTEEEVFAALDEYNLSDRKKEVKNWYDGFTFGDRTDIYNPWSILNYLDKRQLSAYWANSSSNSLVGKLIREGTKEMKQDMERLLRGKSLIAEIDEQIIYNQLDRSDSSIWSLLLASGYLKVIHCGEYAKDTDVSGIIRKPEYELAVTNLEVRLMFQNMVREWFEKDTVYYNDFVKALLSGDVKAMNIYMNKVAMNTFSYFDTGSKPSEEEPERFYHGFVLGLMVELADRYILTSNRESGFGRYDVMLEPRKPGDDGMILEFKVQDPDEEKELADTVQAALGQIKKKNYEAALAERGIPREKIRKYGFAFCGKRVLIGAADNFVIE